MLNIFHRRRSFQISFVIISSYDRLISIFFAHLRLSNVLSLLQQIKRYEEIRARMECTEKLFWIFFWKLYQPLGVGFNKTIVLYMCPSSLRYRTERIQVYRNLARRRKKKHKKIRKHSTSLLTTQRARSVQQQKTRNQTSGFYRIHGVIIVYIAIQMNVWLHSCLFSFFSTNEEKSRRFGGLSVYTHKIVTIAD